MGEISGQGGESQRRFTLILKEYEKETGENWHFYAPLLESELFKSMLEKSKEKMQKVALKDDGEYDLYGLKFAKI